MLQAKSFPRIFWLVRVSWSYFKRKCRIVSPVVAQAKPHEWVHTAAALAALLCLMLHLDRPRPGFC